MKKQLTVALGLAVLAPAAFASKARLEALGEDNFGSYYIHDNRNQFLNPAKINDNKDLATFEFGSSSTGNAVTADSPSTPKSEGGFNKAWNNMVYGLHFGNSTPSATTVRGLGGTGLQERNVWDLFVGGDAGVKWGANLTYEGYDGATNATTGTGRLSSNALRTRIGAQFGDSEAFAQVSINGNAKDYVGNQVKGKSSYFVGFGHMINNYKLFIDYKDISTAYSNVTAATVDQNWDLKELRLGAARQEKLNDKATLFTKLTVENRRIDDKGAATFGASGKIENTIVPATVGLEYDAVSWLQLRTSVTQNLYGQSKLNAAVKTTQTIANTVVRAGASLKFGELTVDGLISTFDPSTNALGAGTTTNGGNGTLRTDNLMSRVSMTYRF
jgi:hypothetical protein